MGYRHFPADFKEICTDAPGVPSRIGLEDSTEGRGGANNGGYRICFQQDSRLAGVMADRGTRAHHSDSNNRYDFMDGKSWNRYARAELCDCSIHSLGRIRNKR